MRLLYLCLIICNVTSLYGQAISYEGRVVVKENGGYAGVIGATVYSPIIDQPEMTDIDGYFDIAIHDSIPPIVFVYYGGCWDECPTYLLKNNSNNLLTLLDPIRKIKRRYQRHKRIWKKAGLEVEKFH